jgi:hypothetical protein
MGGPGYGSIAATVEGGALETIRAAALAFRAADRQLGGGRLYPVVVRFIQTEVAPQLVGHQHPPSAVFSAASSLTDMAGWPTTTSGATSRGSTSCRPSALPPPPATKP